MYAKGQGVAQDYQQALAWYKKAANQGDATAQNNVGWMYFTAKAWRGTTNKLRRGIRRRQTKGIVDAQNNLGVMYDEGFGVAQDAKQAAMWYQKRLIGGTLRRNLVWA